MDFFGGKDDLVDEDLNLRSNAASSAVRVSAMGVGLKKLRVQLEVLLELVGRADHVVEELLEKVILWHPLLQ